MDKTRHKTRFPGIYYRIATAGDRRYIIWYRDSAGKARFRTLPKGSTERDAVQLRAQLTWKVASGEVVAPSKTTVAEWATRWLEEVEPRLRPKTIDGYRDSVENHIIPRLGRIKLHQLSVDDVARMISELQAEGKKANSIRNYLTPLSRMMAVATRRGLCNHNPVRGLDREDLPKADQKKMRILNEKEIEKLLFAASSDRWRSLFATLVFTGLRIGEALALTWEDVDFEAGLLRVGDSKTEAGIREVVVPRFVDRRLRRLRWENTGLGTAEVDFVFRTKSGSPLSKRNTLRALTSTAEKAGIPHVTQHELRHTYASILIGRGFDATLVADQLGHKDPAITLRTYAKLFNPVERRAALRMELDQAFGEARA